jgi:hypothetical protein
MLRKIVFLKLQRKRESDAAVTVSTIPGRAEMAGT